MEAAVEDMSAFLKENVGLIPATIEQVRDGSTYRVCLFLNTPGRPTHQYITLSLSGVKAPSYRKDVPNLPDIIEPFGAESKYFVETRLLQRDIHVILEGISNNSFIGSIVFPLGNIAELLLQEGFAKVQDWTCSMVTGGSAPLRAAELKAKDKKLRIWKDFVQKPVFKVKTIEATVIKILQADSIIIEYGEPKKEKKITFSSIRAPKGKEEKEVYYNSEAKEFLRSRLIGKKVTVAIDFIKPAQDVYEERECGTIKLGEQNISESLLSKGFVYVIRHKKDDDNRSSTYDVLVQAEEKAKNESKGLFSLKDIPSMHVMEASENVNKAKQAFPSLQRAGMMNAIVEYCASASRFKLFIPSENKKLTFIVSGVKCPRSGRSESEKAEPFGNESLVFTNKNLLQRDVKIQIDSMDKVGGFIGNIFITLQNADKPKNFALMLLERGYAFVHDGSAQTNSFSRALYEIQESALALKVGVWSIESNTQVVSKDESNDDKRIPDLFDAIITECSSNGGFFIQTRGQGICSNELNHQ